LNTRHILKVTKGKYMKRYEIEPGDLSSFQGQ